MNLNVHIMSLANLLKTLQEETLSDKVAILSVTDTNYDKPRIDRSKHQCFFLWMLYHDIDVPQDGLILFSREHAERVARFVKNVANMGVTDIICQCVMGQSRSAGMAAAISKHYLNDDNWIFSAKTPNMLVYRLMLEALHGLSAK